MIRARARWALLVFIALAPLTAAQAQEPAPAKPDCRTPRNAIYTLLYYLQGDNNNNPGRAAACISREGLERPASEAASVAIKLKKILDSRGLYVVLDDLPKDPDFINAGDDHEFTLFPDELPGVTWARTPDGRWLLTPEARDRVPEIYSDTFPLNVDDFVEALPDWLRERTLGLQVWQLVALLLLIFLAYAAHRLTIILFNVYVRRAVRRIEVEWLRKAILCGDRPLGLVAMGGVIAIGFPILQFPVGINQVAVLAARVLAAFSLVWLGYRLVDVVTDVLAARAERTDTKLDDQLVPLVRKSLKVFLFLVGSLFILQNLHVDVGSLLAGLGIGGLAFALAAKDTVANLFGSVTIFVDKPFQIGDWVVVGSGVEGTVEEVGFRTTRVRTFYNSLITIPNSMVTNTSVDNLGQRRYRRYKTTLGLTYDTPPEKVQAFCEGVRAIIQAMPGMRQDFYMVEFQDFGPSSLNILLYSFMDVPDWNTELRTRTNLNLSVLRLAEALGVSFAFPTQSLHLESTPKESKARPAGPESVEELIAVVRDFGPRGNGNLPKGFSLSQGYDPGTHHRGQVADDGE